MWKLQGFTLEQYSEESSEDSPISPMKERGAFWAQSGLRQGGRMCGEKQTLTSPEQGRGRIELTSTEFESNS